MPRVTLKKTTPVSKSGCVAGSVLHGSGHGNRGLRLQVREAQARGHDGALQGPFVILELGDTVHASALYALRDRLTDAAEVVRLIRQQSPGCVSIANANILSLAPDGL